MGPSVNRREGDYVLDERLPDRLGRTARANTKSQTTMEGAEMRKPEASANEIDIN